jgi:hypothetical protein
MLTFQIGGVGSVETNLFRYGQLLPKIMKKRVLNRAKYNFRAECQVHRLMGSDTSSNSSMGDFVNGARIDQLDQPVRSPNSASSIDLING